MKLMWPEKIAGLVALLAAVFMFLFWLFLADAARSLLDIRLDRAAFYWSIEIEAILVLPLWLLLRAIHFAKSYWGTWRSRRNRLAACRGAVTANRSI